MFSLDQLVATPPLAAFFSLLLIAGLDQLGLFFLRVLGFGVGSHRDWVRWQAIIVGAMLLAISLYPLALAGLTPRKLMQFISVVLMLMGSWHLFRAAALAYDNGFRWSECSFWLSRQSRKRKLLLLMLSGMGLLALGPITNADALDYHIGVAIAVLNQGGMPINPEWFIGRLAGNGEVLNAMALSVGAEQFGSLLQYASLLSIVGIIYFCNRTTDPQETENSKEFTDLIALAAFSAPVLLFLISAPKPQMWPIAMTTFAFALVVHPERRGLSRRDEFLGFMLICALVMTASQAKFNYLMGGGVVGLLALGFMFTKRRFLPSVGLGLFLALLIIAPPLLWKIIFFDAGWIEALIHPLPGHLPGVDAFISQAKGAADFTSPLPFPLLMFIPTSPGAFSTLLGIGILVFIGLRPGHDHRLWAGTFAALIAVLASAFLAPPSSRMYLEPYFWLVVILSLQANRIAFLKMRFVKFLVLCQAFVVVVASWLGALSVLPGAITMALRVNVMQRAANGYEVMQWADTVLPKNAIVLNGHRSMALLPRDGVSFYWSNFVDITADESLLYLNTLKFRSVSHMLIIGQLNWDLPLANCFGKIIAGPGSGHSATRNPFNRGGNYEAWIVEFDAAKLPECAQKTP